MATSARLFSSGSPGSPVKNPSPPRTEPANGIEGKNKELPGPPCNKLPAWELQRQIVYKQGELLQLLLQASPSFSGSEKCLEDKEQLLHLFREFQAKTQRKETPEFDATVWFVTGVGCFFIFASIILLVRM